MIRCGRDEETLVRLVCVLYEKIIHVKESDYLPISCLSLSYIILKMQMLDAWTSNNEPVLKTVDQLGTCLKGIFHFCSWYSDLLCSIETLNVWIPLYCAPCPLGS